MPIYTNGAAYRSSNDMWSTPNICTIPAGTDISAGANSIVVWHHLNTDSGIKEVSINTSAVLTGTTELNLSLARHYGGRIIDEPEIVVAKFGAEALSVPADLDKKSFNLGKHRVMHIGAILGVPQEEEIGNGYYLVITGDAAITNTTPVVFTIVVDGYQLPYQRVGAYTRGGATGTGATN